MATEKEPKILKEEYVEYIPDIIPVNVDNYQDEFLYGKSIEPLDYNTQIRNKPTASSGITTKIGYFTVTATGSKVITGVWFTPSLVQFFYTDQAWWSWAGSMTTTSQFAHDYMGSWSSDQTHCIYLRDAWSTTVCYCTYTSMDADWFTINVATGTGTTRVDYIAYL